MDGIEVICLGIVRYLWGLVEVLIDIKALVVLIVIESTTK